MPEIQLQILSDLHLEAPAAYDMFEITPRATILALLGDIGQARDPGWIQFIERQLALFRIVLLVLGNHEPYYSSWEQVREQVRYFNEAREKQKQQGQGKLVLLDQGRYDVTDDFTILGCTLHSRIDAKHEERVSFGLNDFYYIENGWDVSKHSQAHKDDLAWLNGQVTSLAQEAPHRRIAILTHHSPCITANAMDPKNATSPIRSAFATDLSAEPCWTSKNVKLWAFGHTHFNCDFVDEGTGKHVLTNQRGYYFSQAAGFDAEKVVTIENSDMPGSVFKDTDATRVLSSPTTCSTHTNAFHNHVTMASQLPSQCLDNNLVAGITRILDEAGIPSVLWGNYLLSVFGVPTIVDVGSPQYRYYNALLTYPRMLRLLSQMV